MLRLELVDISKQYLAVTANDHVGSETAPEKKLHSGADRSSQLGAYRRYVGTTRNSCGVC